MGGTCCCQGENDRTRTERPIPDSEYVGQERPFQIGPLEAKVAAHPQVRTKNGKKGTYYALEQTFAVVRHADRMDHEESEWNGFAERERFPNDTPLSSKGHPHAKRVAETFKQMKKGFGLVISSPYLRCAQTAANIAQALNVPVQFDLDVGEIFDNVSMEGDIDGKEQHRSPEELDVYLKEYPDVTFIRDGNGRIKVEGKLQRFPEGAQRARMRFTYKVKKLVQRAVTELMSIVIVTHGDAVAAVVGMLRPEWNIGNIPYASFAVASRQIKVLESQSEAICADGMSVFNNTAQWDLKTSSGLQYFMKGRAEKRQSVVQHEKHIKQMNNMADEIQTDYQLTQSVEEPENKDDLYKEALADLGATGEDAEAFMDGMQMMDSIQVERIERGKSRCDTNTSNLYIPPVEDGDPPS